MTREDEIDKELNSLVKELNLTGLSIYALAYGLNLYGKDFADYVRVNPNWQEIPMPMPKLPGSK